MAAACVPRTADAYLCALPRSTYVTNVLLSLTNCGCRLSRLCLPACVSASLRLRRLCVLCRRAVGCVSGGG
eukprot:scaffold3461_cov116-Isochrysis_galbana.AAC.10